MSTPIETISFSPVDNARLMNLCGALDDNLRQIETALDVAITRRNEKFKIAGRRSREAAQVLESFYLRATRPLDVEDVQLGLVELKRGMEPLTQEGVDGGTPVLMTRKGDLFGRTPGQNVYIKAIQNHDVTFGIGPAGTGKTYLAVALAAFYLKNREVERIILTRPAVEAGEKLGFLPGDLQEKIDPYLRPLYDALYEMLGFEYVAKLIERQVIEVAPLAYMRGRTLNNSFIILDESQNTTIEQMKMFLTRIGFNSKAVITGDITQIDLPRSTKSGLRHAIEVLAEVDEISFNFFHSEDVVRHPVVARIVNAYEAWEAADQKRKAELAAERKREAQEQEQK